MTPDDTPCTITLREEWETCNHLARSEAWSRLYYARFRRLAPGKSEPLGSHMDSGDDENRAQCADWHTSGLAKRDAIMSLAAAWERIEALERQIDDLTPE